MKRKSQKEFIKQVESLFPGKYNFDKTVYINNKTKVIVICKECGYEWNVFPTNLLLNKHCCPNCNKGRKKYFSTLRNQKFAEFVETSKTIHNCLYRYDKVDYKNCYTKVTITCPIHGDFKQTPNHHLSGQGCPECNKLGVRSKGELYVSEVLRKLEIAFQEQVSYSIPNWNHKVIVDFVFTINNTTFFIEYNGKQHYVPIKFFGGELSYQFQSERDQTLRDYCSNNNIKLLELRYDTPLQQVDSIIQNFIEDGL